ncbi:unnamed protein product [Closterium sp. NIES-53]
MLRVDRLMRTVHLSMPHVSLGITCTRCLLFGTQVFTDFVETVNGVLFSRDHNTLILTIHKAHRITGAVARPIVEHGFNVQHLTNTQIVNIRGSVPETGLPHLQAVGDALKAHFRVMLMRCAITSRRFQFDYLASITEVGYADMLEWLGDAWTQLLIEKFKVRRACYMTAVEFVNCDAGLCVEQRFIATSTAST